MTTSPSIEGIARWLVELLPTVDLRDGFLQWQAQLLGNSSGHVFVPHGVEMSMPTLWQAVLEFSLAKLSIRQSLPICAHRTICLKANSNVWRVKSRRLKCGVDSKRGTFNNSNRLHPTPNTTVFPCCQDNPLLYNRRRAFHIIRLPLRRLPHPLHPLLPSHPLPLAQDSIARLVAMAAHIPHPLIAKVVLCMLCVCSASMMTKIALSQYNAPNSLIVQDSFVRSLPPFRLRLPLCLFYLPFLPSHRTHDGTAPFTCSSVLVYNHPRRHQPGERSI